MSEKSSDAPPVWWSVPQAVVWISTRSEIEVSEAVHHHGFGDALLGRKTAAPVGVGDEIPIPLEVAPGALLRKAIAGRIRIVGRQECTSEPAPIAVSPDFRIGDDASCRATIWGLSTAPAPTITVSQLKGIIAEGSPLLRQAQALAKARIGADLSTAPPSDGPRPWWQHLVVKVAECKAIWPPAPEFEQASPDSRAGTSIASGSVAVAEREHPMEVSNRVEARVLPFARATVAGEQVIDPLPDPNAESADAAEAPKMASTSGSDELVAERFVPKIPTYSPAITYAKEHVPNEFKTWAEEQHARGVLITVSLAYRDMAGPADGKGKRHGGILRVGAGLARRTIEAWVKTLPDGWYAKRGETQDRRKTGLSTK